MKEFKFWALPFSYKQLLLLAIPIWIIFLVAFFFIKDQFFYYFYYIFGFIIIFSIISIPITLKRVKVVLINDEIQIFYYGRLKYSTTINNLEYIKGPDIISGSTCRQFIIVFNDRSYTFNGMNSSISLLSPKDTRVDFLIELMLRYDLKKEFYSEWLIDKTYLYTNPNYNPSPTLNTKGYNKSER